MDHLPIPKGRLRSVPSVPYLSRLVDPNEFTMFHYDPSTGIDKALLPNLRDMPGDSMRDFFAYVQSELYFGLLKQVFDRDFIEDDFVNSTVTERPMLDSAKLPIYMNTWVVKMRKSRSHNTNDWVRTVRTQTQARWLWCNVIDIIVQDTEAEYLMLLSSIRILVISLLDMILTYNPACKETIKLAESYRLSTEQLQWPRVPPSYRPIVSFMIELEWCFPEILRMLRTYSLTTVLYVMHFQHNLTNHDLCHERLECVSRNIDNSTYRAQHVSPSCMCEPVGPNVSEVIRVLKSGEIPLVRCSISKDNEITFEVLPAKSMKQHIAISHVWSDGLAVPHQNKMFKCQLLALFPYMHKARRARWNDAVFFGKYFAPPEHPILWWEPSHTFWVDVFCIPVIDDEDSRGLRETAIGFIAPTFSGAYSVLVFDKTLVAAPEYNESTVEIAARVVTSSWMSRSWTFLEASLAVLRDTFICTGGDIVNIIDIAIHCEKPGSLGYHLLNRDLASAFEPFRVLQNPRIDLLYLHSVWNALANRTLSHPTEIWGIAATLLGYNGGEVMSQKEIDQRLLCIMRTLKRVPRAFLFKKFPRSDQYPIEHRWVPANISWPIYPAEGYYPIVPQGISIRPTANVKYILREKHLPPTRFVLCFNPLALRNTSRPDSSEPLSELHFIIEFNDFVADHEPRYLRSQQTFIELCFILDTSDVQQLFSKTHTDVQGQGVCVAITDRPKTHVVHTEFFSSFSYRMVNPDLVLHDTVETDYGQLSRYQLDLFADWVIISCEPENWYRPKYHRKDQPVSILSKEFYYWFFIGAIPVVIAAAGVIIAYTVTLKFVHTLYRRTIVYWTIFGVAIALVLVYTYLLLMFDRLVFENWVRSFRRDEKDRAPKHWWHRIMPH